MKIHKIHITDFKCIDELELDFDYIKGFWEIEGVVGAGKTTIGEALLYGLFGTVRDKNNNSLIRWGKKRSVVEVWCESKSHHLYIKRILNSAGASPLSVVVDGEPIVFTNKRDAQQQLEKEYYDVSRLMLETLCIISFKGFKSLSSMNTRDTNEFLDQAFGFNIISQYAAECVDLRRGDINNMTKLNTDIAAIERQIKGYQEWQQKDEHVTAKDLEDAQLKLKNLESEWKSIHNSFIEIRKHLDAEYTNLKSSLAVVKTQGTAIKKNIDFISKGVCPTCGQPLDQSHLAEHQAERTRLITEYRSIEEKINAVAKQSNDLLLEQSQAEQPVEKKLDEIKRTISHLQDQIRQQKQFTSKIANLQDELADVCEQRDITDKSVSEWNELQQILLRDVKDKILRSIIPSINTYIEQYMRELHQPYIVKFDETFTCSVQVTGMDNEVPTSSLSTGQLKTVDMIIILSILKVLLSNVDFNIIFLDELLTNMHDELRDMMCKMLKENILSDKSMFIISHAPLNDTYIDGRIHVDYRNGLSEYHLYSI